MKTYKHPNARIGPDLGPGRDKNYSKHVHDVKERIGKIIKKTRNVFNFYDIQMKAPDPGGKAMFQAAMEELRRVIEESEHAVGTQKHYEKTAKEFYHD